MSLSPAALGDRLSNVTVRDRHRLTREIERARRQPRDRADQTWARIESRIDAAEARRASRAAAVPEVHYPADLPVTTRRQDIMDAIRDHQVVVVAGETGSGKTTQIPKMCLELGRGVDGMIGHTQPRRIAARAVAERLAEEMAVTLGESVGYAVRFTDTVSERTLVKVMTDGILLAEVRGDPLLTAYDTILVDEAHERSLNIDFLLGYLTQLLPRRPDLKVIVTSATIDTARFAAHFGAPVVEVSGRTYPVEVRYRPLLPEAATPDSPPEDERDLDQAICDAVDELVAEGPGDVLVFLPGERAIRDAAEALRNWAPGEVEILPLYARLSAAEQHRVFRQHSGRRVVLATNVAETSLTVPGIRFVVDTGLARISRYSHRTKVQRLPIEAVSRASANQRAGRCGRVAAGVCIRLYTEEDYDSRPEFTDPEILRTNLASVILQMAAIGLGDIESFPFIEAPDRRSVTDGRALLEELGAFAPEGESARRGRLTPIGRRLARVPLDPRLGRMVLEAERRGCLREVTVIAAALSIQDPRERPADKVREAGELHARFETKDSDFLAYVELWDYLARLQTELSGNQFRKRCRAEFLSVLRIREWQDVVGQIRQIHRAEGIHPNSTPARPDDVHQALLCGLLSHIGMRDRAQGDYRGARNSRWQIGRGSALSSRPPAWAMAGSLVETERTWARTLARIDPGWAERAGAHLVKRTHSEPWWDPERGEAMVEERATLYGLPVVAARPVALTRIDREAAREIFIRRALVEQDWSTRLPAFERTRTLEDQILAVEERARRKDLLAPEEARFDFYESRVPADISTGRQLQKWWSRVRHNDPEALDIPLAILLNPAAGPVDLGAYPDYWTADGVDLRLRYRFEPGNPSDGVTVAIPLSALSRVEDRGFDWNIPGYRQELVTALVRTLPKAVRRALGPAPEVAKDLLTTTGPADGPLLPVLAARLAAQTGDPVRPDMWDLAAIPSYLTMAFEVIDHDGSVRGRSRSLRHLKEELRHEVRAAIARAIPGVESHGATAWEFGTLPRRIEKGMVRAFPALVDEGESVGVALLDNPGDQAATMWRGVRRLLLLAAPLPSTHVQRRLTNATKLAVASSADSMEDLLADCATAVADQLLVATGGPPFEPGPFETMAANLRRSLEERVVRLATIAGGILAAATQVGDAVAKLERRDHTAALGPALADVEGQVRSLTRPGFVTSAGAGRLGQLLRYLDAAGRRLERLPGDIRRDAERMAVVRRVSDRYNRLLDLVAAGYPPPGGTAGLADVRWMIEELRVSLWAQQLGTPAPVSEARIMRILEGLAG